MTDEREELIMAMGLNPVLAHEVLFKHRHALATQPFHRQIIKDWHSDIPNILEMVFRGGAKSSIAEEAICTMACLQKFKNGLVIGETETRAVERLAAIKHEFETNEDIYAIFGDMKGAKWQETRIELSNGTIIHAYGRGQSLRGVKHLHYRPDIAFLDDLEDEESVRSEETLRKTFEWFLKTLMPAMAPKARMRMAATPLHRDALALKLARLSTWQVRKIPIMYKDDNGDWQSSWPDAFPINTLTSMRSTYEQLGQMHIWQQEYMMEPENPADKIFTQDLFRYEPHIKTWQPTYAVYDPARTTKQTSAYTGKVVGSWINNRLIIWQSDAQFWKPDEIIEDIFRTADQYNPVAIGVEEDGLHEFIMQPLRHAQTARGQVVPIKPLKAPKGKIDFIKSLQPYFKAGEVIFAGDPASHAKLTEQLLSFPGGRIDAPNALAYFLRLRPGLPIYDDFNMRHITDSPRIVKSYPLYLAVNATQQLTAAALVQVYDGTLTVLADWMREGDPGATLAGIIREVGVYSARTFRCIVPPSHFEAWDVVGLKGAARRIPVEIQIGGSLLRGREEIRQMLSRTTKGHESVRVSTEALWTLRALSGGYAREIGHNDPTGGPYKVLCEALESFAATLTAGVSVDEGDDNQLRYAYAADGRRYITSLPQKASRA